MNLEMEGDTDALAADVEAVPPRELEPQPYDDFDIAVIRALQGPMEVADRPYDAAAAEVGLATDDFLEHLAGMVERKILRRVAAILYHRRAGFSANGMGVWRVPDDRRSLDVGGRMAAVRGISHCYQRPTYADWPYSVFTMAHGRSKEECDAVLDSIADEHDLHGEDRAVLYSSTEFKKIRLHYFTPDYEAWERSTRRRRTTTPRRRPMTPIGRALRAGGRAAAGRRQLAGPGDAARSAATRSSSTAPRAPQSGTPTATATSTGSAPGAR